MDRHRPLRAADRDVDVQAEHELAARDARELRGQRVVARAAVQLAERGGEGMHAGARDEPAAVERRQEVAARLAQDVRGAADGPPRRRDRLDLGGDELGLEAGVDRERDERLVALRRQVQRARVQQHELLLDADRRSARGVEPRAHRRSVERGDGAVDGRLEGHVCGGGP